MDQNTGKNDRQLPQGYAVLDGGIIYVPNEEHSWLETTVEQSKKTCQGQERAFAAEIFLKTSLLPLVESGQQPDEAQLVILLTDFKRARPDLNTEFEMAHIVARLLNHFQYFLLDDFNTDENAQSDAMRHEMDLFFTLEILNFQRIDSAVRERLQSD